MTNGTDAAGDHPEKPAIQGAPATSWAQDEIQSQTAPPQQERDLTLLRAKYDLSPDDSNNTLLNHQLNALRALRNAADGMVAALAGVDPDPEQLDWTKGKTVTLEKYRDYFHISPGVSDSSILLGIENQIARMSKDSEQAVKTISKVE